MLCPKCHVVSTGTDLFCRECGTRLDQPAQMPTEVLPAAFDSATVPAAPTPAKPFNSEPQTELPPPTMVLDAPSWSRGGQATPYAPQNFSGGGAPPVSTPAPSAKANSSYATLIIGGLLGILLAGGLAVWLMWPKPVEQEHASQSNSAKANGGETAALPATDATPVQLTTQGSKPASVSSAERAEEKIVANVLLTQTDLAGASASELQRLRNTVYARHGRTFKTAELQSYFNTRAWYAPRTGYNDSDLNGTDRANLNLILAAEKRAGGL